MNATTKTVLYGIGTFILCAVILSVIRPLIKGLPIVEGFKDWTNWAIAACSGISAALSSYNKNKAKENNKDKQ